MDRGALLKNGVDVTLRPKSFKVLCYLVEHHGLLVTKDEVMRNGGSGLDFSFINSFGYSIVGIGLRGGVNQPETSNEEPLEPDPVSTGVGIGLSARTPARSTPYL